MMTSDLPAVNTSSPRPPGPLSLCIYVRKGMAWHGMAWCGLTWGLT